MLALTILIAASAGWEGKLHFTHDPPRKSGGSEGAIHVSGTRLRIEEPTPMGLTVVLASAGRVRLLFPERKQFIDIDAKESALAAPPLSLQGMRRIGKSQLSGRDCTIWEKILSGPLGRIRQRLWVPVDTKRFVFLRFVTSTPRGATSADVTDLKESPQPRALFRTPADYTRK